MAWLTELFNVCLYPQYPPVSFGHIFTILYNNEKLQDSLQWRRVAIFKLVSVFLKHLLRDPYMSLTSLYLFSNMSITFQSYF